MIFGVVNKRFPSGSRHVPVGVVGLAGNFVVGIKAPEPEAMPSRATRPRACSHRIERITGIAVVAARRQADCLASQAVNPLIVPFSVRPLDFVRRRGCPVGPR